MVRKKRKTWIIYPEYFDKNLSRSDGRRVPIKFAVSSPKLEEIGKVLDAWDVPNRLEESEHHPATWFERNGRIFIPKQKKSKQKLLKKLGKELKERRK